MIDVRRVFLDELSIDYAFADAAACIDVDKAPVEVRLRAIRRAALERHTHFERSEKHGEVGRALHASVGNEWASVCNFYAAYHLVKAAMLADPLFDDPSPVAAAQADLNMDDRYTERHRRRKSRDTGRVWGVNDLVVLVYQEPGSRRWGCSDMTSAGGHRPAVLSD
jgi:hypothetical protein